MGKEKASFSCLWAALWSSLRLREFFKRGISAADYCPKDFRGLAFRGMDGASILPKQARYQLRYTRLLSFLSGWAYSPKSRALPTALHPDIHFSAIIPRRREKSKIFLSVVIYVVKAAFIPLSAIGGNPANTGVTRLCGVSPCLVSDSATALPKQARYQLR